METPAAKSAEAATPQREPGDIHALATQRTFLTQRRNGFSTDRHIMIKILQVKYGSEAPSMLKYHKHVRIETSTTRRGFNCSLSQKRINLPLNNRMMSCHHLDIKLPQVTQQGRMGPKLKMVTQNHTKHKPVGCNASSLIISYTSVVQ